MLWLDTLAPLSDGATRRAAAPMAFRPFRIRGIVQDGRQVPVEEDVATTLPFGQVRRFRRPGAGRRVLVVAPLAGSFPLLMRDLVAGLLHHAPEVAVTDWPDPRHVPLAAGRFGFDENVLETAQMIRALGPGAHVVGVCQGVIAAFAASALLAEDGLAPLSLTLLGGPVDPARNPTRLDRTLAAKPLSALGALMEQVPVPFAGASRSVFPRRRQMQAFGFYLWRQALNGGELPLKLVLDDGTEPFLFPLTRLCWDMMDIPAEFFLENVGHVFQARSLARGTLEVAGRRVRPEALERTALLTGEAAQDDIAAPGQTGAAQDLCRAMPDDLRRRLLVPRAGHFSLFYGKRMREEVLPPLANLMEMAEQRLG
ncbi:hypothetical protein ABLE91_22145 [Aquabacter sp. CN5-332]|uniref:hypothetical protein n=1 Tax=Aquabacter sp. CN5-332 TaxID=3156608 RepID=UPI0032B34A56